MTTAAGSSRLLTEFKDTTSQAKSGGTWKDSTGREPSSFEPSIRDITSTFHVLSTYETLIRTKATAFKNYDPEVVEVAWPALGNFAVCQGDNTAYNSYWTDDTGEPLKS